MKKKPVRIMASWFLGISYAFLLLGYCVIWGFVLHLFLIGGTSATSPQEALVGLIIVSIIAIIMFTTIALLAHRAYAIISIYEKGIKKALFKRFHKREILWDEVQDMRIVGMITGWLFVSKGSLEGQNYNDLIKRKDTIQLPLSKKVVLGIRQYTDKPILGVTDEMLKNMGVDPQKKTEEPFKNSDNKGTEPQKSIEEPFTELTMPLKEDS